MENKKNFILIIVLSLIIVGGGAFVFGRYLSSNSYGQLDDKTNTKQHRNLSTVNKRESQSQRKKRGEFAKKVNFDSRGNKSSCILDLDNLSSIDITNDIKDGLILMREEEKLARDVYLKLADLYDIKVFGNIEKAEQQHMDSMLKILEKYSIKDPVLSDDIGEFSSIKLKGLYSDLIDKGSKSLNDAIQVGIDIEKLDISDLENLIKDIDNNTDVYTVYEHLLEGSYRHLKAFERQ